MFNNYSVSNHVNAVTGNIIKTYKDSYFLRFHLKSSLSDKLLNKDPHIGDSYNGNKINVVVIQMVICGDMEVIAEIMDKDKYDKLFMEVE